MIEKRLPVIEIIEPNMVEILRRKTPAQRLKQAFDMWDLAMVILRASIARDYPEWSDEQIQQEVFRRVRHKDLK